MKISTIKYIESLPGYSRGLDEIIDAATLAGIGHERYNPEYTPTAEQIDACIAYVDSDDADPFDSTLSMFFDAKTMAERRADKTRALCDVRSLLLRLERDITIGGVK